MLTNANTLNAQPEAHEQHPNKFFIAYYFISSIGIAAIFYRLGTLLGEHVGRTFHRLTQFNDWAMYCLNADKPAQIMGYLFSASALFLYYFVAHLFFNSGLRSEPLLQSRSTKVEKGILLLLNLSAGVSIFIFNDLSYCAGALIFWTAILIFPFLNPRSYRVLSWTILCLTLSSLVFLIVQPYRTSSNLLVSNDYMDIPEYTLMAKHQYIDNIHFINQYRIGGLKKFDPRASSVFPQLVAEHDYIKLTYTPALSQYMKAHRFEFSYDKNTKGIFVHEKFKLEQKNSLDQVVLKDAESRSIEKYYKFNNSLSNRAYSETEREFIKKNTYEFFNQTIAGHYFHHHHALLGAINEYNLGKSSTNISYIYGWLNTVTLAKILSHHSIVSFANYIKLTYLFYPFYFFLVALVAFILFRNIYYVAPILVLYAASLTFISFESIHIAPGFNPMRHFYDMLVLLGWYGYLFAKRRNLFYFVAAAFCSVMAFLADREFGLFIASGFFIASFINFHNRRKIKSIEMLFWLLGALSLVAVPFFIKVGKSASLIYSLIGVSTPGIEFNEMGALLCLLCGGYAFIFLKRWQDNRWKFVALYLLIYAQAGLIYYVWYSEPGHLFVFAATWILLFAILFREMFHYSFLAAKQLPVLCLIAIFSFSFMFIPSAVTYFIAQRTFLRVFNDHRTYYWDMPTAQFVTTMDPAPFKNAIDLIHHYSHENGIYIISKYDNFLPFLAERYSEMPFLQMDLSLVTSKEVTMAAQTILKNHPTYLFVDSDIQSSRYGDLIWPNDSINAKILNVSALSYGRFLVLRNLTKVFDLVSAHYQPIARGQLITVYRAIDDQNDST